jgi:hypothetical protein
MASGNLASSKRFATAEATAIFRLLDGDLEVLIPLGLPVPAPNIRASSPG